MLPQNDTAFVVGARPGSTWKQLSRSPEQGGILQLDRVTAGTDASRVMRGQQKLKLRAEGEVYVVCQGMGGGD